MRVTLTALEGFAIDKRYTCDGANVTPPLKWTTAPRHTQELLLFFYEVKEGRMKMSWAMAGLSPRSTGMREESVPAGAVLGANAEGEQKYSVCPAHRTLSSLDIVIVAMPHKLSLRPGFDAVVVLGEALRQSDGYGITTTVLGQPR